jgi:hypothetical protein
MVNVPEQDRRTKMSPTERRGVTRRSVVALVPAAAVAVPLLAVTPAHARPRTFECALDLVMS